MVMGNSRPSRSAEPMEPKSEEISLLMDGELDAARARCASARSLRESDGVATWVCYHVIGDTLRGSARRHPDSRRASPRDSRPSRRCSRRDRGKPRRAADRAGCRGDGGGGERRRLGRAVARCRRRRRRSPRRAQASACARRTRGRPSTTSICWLTRNIRRPTAIQGVRPYLRAVAASEPDARP